jgi:hypothetical protein
MEIRKKKLEKGEENNRTHAAHEWGARHDLPFGLNRTPRQTP